MPTLSRFVQALVEYAEQQDEDSTLIIPEDLTTLSDEELAELHTQAVSSFDAIYGDGKALTADDVTVLSQITSGIEALQAESTVRAEAAAEREAAAAELASRIRPEDSMEDPEAEQEQDQEQEVNPDAEALPSDEQPVEEDEGAAQSVAASGHKEIRVNLGNMRSRQRPPAEPADTPRSMRDVMLAADVPGFAAGTGLDWEGVGKAVDRRLAGFNQSQYAAAAKAGRHMREQLSVAVIRKPFDESLVIRNSDPAHVDEVLRNAVNEKRLPGGSLVASGGWCAPSETIYDLFEIVLPEAMLETKPDDSDRPVTVAIKEDGDIYLNDELVDMEVLRSKLAVEAQKKPQPQVDVRADATTRYRIVQSAVKTAKEVGIRRVGFVATPEH